MRESATRHIDRATLQEVLEIIGPLLHLGYGLYDGYEARSITETELKRAQEFFRWAWIELENTK